LPAVDPQSSPEKLPAASPPTGSPSDTSGSLKRGSGVLLPSPTMTQEEAIAAHEALVVSLSAAAGVLTLTSEEQHEANSAMVFAEHELANLKAGTGNFLPSVEEPAQKKSKSTKVGKKTDVEVQRAQNKGGFTALEDMIGVNSNAPLADGKKLSKKAREEQEAEEQMKEAEGDGQEE
jgi:hypothetical protein